MGGLPQRKGAAFPRSKRRSRGSLLGDRIVIWTSLVIGRRYNIRSADLKRYNGRHKVRGSSANRRSALGRSRLLEAGVGLALGKLGFNFMGQCPH